MTTLVLLLQGILVLPLALPAGQARTWEEHKAVALQGVQVALSAPVLVARSKGYLWFPTLIRRGNGDLLALMSNYADVHTSTSTGLACWSRDGGLTWTAPSPARYGDSHVLLPSGDLVVLPYYLFPRSKGVLGASYQLCRKNERTLALKDGLTAAGWPRPDRSFDAKLGLAGFVFNGQTLQLKDGQYLATLYGHFKDDKRYSLVTAVSGDGISWRIRSVIAGPDCKLKGAEGPCEAALCRQADGRIMVVFRLASGVPYGQVWSADEGRTWTEPVAMTGVFSVQPSLAVLPNGMLALSGGRPGLFLWLNTDGTGKGWQKVDLQAHHNACLPREPISKPNQTSAYTEVIAVDDRHLLVIYDRIPHGWSAIPKDAQDSNSVWVVRIRIKKA